MRSAHVPRQARLAVEEIRERRPRYVQDRGGGRHRKAQPLKDLGPDKASGCGGFNIRTSLDSFSATILDA